MKSPALLLVAVLAFGAQQALACSCWRPTPKQLLESPALIFSGTVVQVDKSPATATFAVHKLYKGVISGDRVAIRFNSGPGSACGIALNVGESHTVFAGYGRTAQGDAYSIGLCSLIPYRSAPYRFQPALDAHVLEVAAARRKVESNPRSGQALDELAKIHEGVNDHFSALRELNALKSLSPADAIVPARIGEAHTKLGQHAEALTAFDAALALDSKLERAKRGREQGLVQLGRVAELDSSRRDYSGMTLPKADFSGKDLDNANFSKARLGQPRFDDAQLANADFSSANIHGGSFSNAKMNGARFDGASTYQVNFTAASLSGARFSGASMRMAHFRDADLRKSDFTGVQAEKAVFAGAHVQGASFKNAFLFNADFSGVDLSGVDFRDLELQGGVFRNARLANADLTGAMLAGPIRSGRSNEALYGPGRSADLRGADLTGAKLDGADIRYALVDCKTQWPEGFDPRPLPLVPVSSKECPVAMRQKTTLLEKPGTLREMPGRIGGERAKTRGAVLERLDLSGADLRGLGLSGFRFSRVNLAGAVLRGTDLRNADFQGSNLAGADLRDADLSGAQFLTTDLTGADLTGARLSGAQFNARTQWPAGFDAVAAGAIDIKR